MTPLDHDELARLMGLMTDDQAMVVPFVQAFGDRLAGNVRYHLRQLNRRDLAADTDEVQGLVWDVALFLQERAGAWQPGVALPWNWARRGIAKVIVDAIGHARADVDIEMFDLAPDESSAPVSSDVGLADLAGNPVVALLIRALDEIGCSDRDRQIHIEYRRQWGSGDPSPANTVGRAFRLRPDHIRQIDRRVRTRLSALADTRPEYAALADLPWLSSQRSPMPGKPTPVMAA
jgi:hypothetical protein